MSYDVDALRAREFPWAARGERIYLDHAATGPLPQRARDAQAEANALRAELWRVGFDYFWDGVVTGRGCAARLLKEGYGIGLLADQSGLGAATHVPFFGRPARTPRGPAVFALRFGAPLIFVVAARQPNGKFILHLEEVPVQATGNLEADVEVTVTRFTAVLEKWVRRYPGQYLWAHRRWKRQLDDTPPELREP